MSIDLATIISLVGALGVGSVGGQWFGGAKDRRAARAAVLEKLGAAERARWPKSEDELDDAQKLVDAVRGLGTVALLARVPRPAVWVYSQLATAATWYIREDIEMDGFGPEYGTGAAWTWTSPTLCWTPLTS